MNKILQDIERSQEKLLNLLIQIAKIPSPTGFEKVKIEYIKDQLSKLGLKKVIIDDAGNCIANLPAQNKSKQSKTILVVAHTDTACDPGGEVQIREDKKYIYGHGICDNSAGVVGLLTTLELIQKNNLKFPHNLIFGFTVGEEGLGAKRGMKAIIKRFGKEIDAVINVESHHIGRVTNQAIGQYRSEIIIDTKIGGHSYRDFGRPNANVILASIISDFSKFKLSQKKGKTTFNIGDMKGEASINAIASKSACLFEIRSEDNDSLLKTQQKLESILNQYRKKFPGVEITNNISAQVPAVTFSKNHKIYHLTTKAQKKLGITPKINAGNTDGDVSLAANIPTVTIGTSEGWNTHSFDEYMEKASLSLGIKQVFLVINEVASNY
ncbi:M20/M25/M40 family metallo-hydrolase [Candidatus Daviesbacteria bacterium]|nr:M20/M25/M40 family metallo-hydrolase [Candidatus Daviesbacteria bacterium]